MIGNREPARDLLMLTDIKTWPMRLLLAFASGCAAAQLTLYLGFLFWFSRIHEPPPDNILRDPFYVKLFLGGLLLLSIGLPLLWPRILIWPVLGMLGTVLGFNLLVARSAWRESESGPEHIFSEPLFLLALLIPALFLALLLPAAWRLLHREISPPSKERPAKKGRE